MQVALATGPACVVAHTKAVRALAHWGVRPLAALPEVPSLNSLGQPVRFAQCPAILVPAGRPEPIAQRLRAAAREVAAEAAVVQTVNRAGSRTEHLDAPEFQVYGYGDAKLMTEAVRRIGNVE
jgi:tripartite-type tricarboxylate transporter receptor subunit TctC